MEREIVVPTANGKALLDSTHLTDQPVERRALQTVLLTTLDPTAMVAVLTGDGVLEVPFCNKLRAKALIPGVA